MWWGLVIVFIVGGLGVITDSWFIVDLGVNGEVLMGSNRGLDVHDCRLKKENAEKRRRGKEKKQGKTSYPRKITEGMVMQGTGKEESGRRQGKPTQGNREKESYQKNCFRAQLQGSR
ncbi:hypothetical protein QL285_086416 [Trifolium repens]|nr:hypothetical protein QL285_086416 [Trifolium repens]